MNTATQTATANRKATRTTSDAVRIASEKNAKYAPILVKGISAGELMTITPSMFGRLNVDPSYQRGETVMVNQIVRAIQAGGSILDPVTLCERKGGDELWIVDGFQRVCAFQQTKTPFKAMVHRSDSAESEHQFFIALNAKRAVSANVIVKAWTGPSGSVLRRANESLEHPLSGRINFAQGSNSNRISASSIVGGMLLATGSGSRGRIEVMLSRLDMAMSKSLVRARVEHYLRLVGMISERVCQPALVLRALGDVAAERWERDVVMPNRKVIERLANKNWEGSVILSAKYYPILLETVRKVWKS